MPGDWFDEGSNGAALDVAALLDSPIVAELAAIVTAGALVGIGTTSDGGALSMQVTLDGRWKRTYVRTVEEALDWLGGARHAVESAADVPPASPGPRKRSRRPQTGL